MNQTFDFVFELLPAFIWLVIILAIGFGVRKKHIENPLYRFYMPNLLMKLFFGLAFASYYYFGIEGDTVAYYQSGEALTNLLFESPSAYFSELFSENDSTQIYRIYSVNTGFPKGWIYKEPEGFFIAKILSIFNLVTFKSFFATTFLIAFLTANATWKLFLFISKMKLTQDRFLAFALLLIPSVNFWCTGISKDSFIYISICYLTVYAFRTLAGDRLKLRDYVFIGLYIYLIISVRSFIFYILLIPFALAWTSRLIKKIGANDFTLMATRTLLLIGGISLITLNLVSKSEEEILESNTFLNEASITQKDFASNDTYGDNRYSIGEIEFTFLGLVQVAPAAIFAGAFRPILTEALEPSLILNGLESILLLFALLRFFSKGALRKYRFIRTNEFLYFCLIFVFLLSFITGLTSGLFGVLVRLRAPLLPFLTLLLLVDYSSTFKPKESQKNEGESAKLA